ncbi:MAG: Kae1-associated kinase Bud32 [Nitrososphaerota archaeon]|nr:Kae1-associated kinase Bud32 [Nitrososphaerota archaeon]
MRLFYRGAEADIFLGDWAGSPAVFKFRKPLPYRLPELDEEIRGQRTVHEASIIGDARSAGLRVPYLYYVSPRESLIVMQRIEGPRLKSYLQSASENRGVSEEFGRTVGVLHRSGIMHGDLTTSNVIVADGGVHLIDFGLATHSLKVEDHAVDLRLIKETLVGAHSRVSSAVMASFLAGYASVVGEKRVKEVVRKLAEIERRGRYARVE